MRHISDRFTALLDANVLYPFMVRDVLLTLAYAGLYRPLWTNTITDEWRRNLIAAKPHLEPNLRDTVETMERAFPEAIVGGYEDLIPSFDLPDPDDRHVLAAAVKGSASLIVTENLGDFPEAILSQYGIEACTADEFIVNTIQLYTTDAVAALREMRSRYDAPAMTPDELRLALIAAGLVLTTAELGPHLPSL